MEDVLPASLLQTILARTDAVDCARVACVNRRWRSLAHDDALWSQHCRDEYGVSSAVDFTGNPCCSFKEAYAVWHDEFNQYGGLVYRTKRLWDDLKEFLCANYPAVADSLGRQASEADIAAAESALGWKFPPHVRLLYRFCDGQRIGEEGDEIGPQYVGLLGGYYFYNHFVNVQLLPLQQVVSYTLRLLSSKHSIRGKRIVVAASCNLKKFFLVDCEDGMVYVGTKNFLKNGEVMPCLPPSSGAGDGMLRWLEEYRDGLLSSKFTVRDDEIQSISLFPDNGPTCSEAVTQGIQVRVSSVFVPELSELEGGETLFSYSVRMRFLPVSGLSFNQCQLSRRHWVVSADDVIVDEVRGEGVVGMYPLLRVGGDVFVYESCSNQTSSSGSIEGDLTFVPGSLSRQEGPEFSVRVASFPLKVPRYIF